MNRARPVISAIVPALAAIATSACAPAPVAAVEPTRLNLLVVLDLSDRIESSRAETRDQAGKDRQVVRDVAAVFADEVRRKRFIFSRDRLMVAVAPQAADYRSDVVASAETLRIDVASIPPRDRRQRLPQLERDLVARVDALYDKASRASHYQGADIWSFFRNNLGDYLPCPAAGDRTRNVLVVITDGYLDFEDAVQCRRPRQGNRTSFMDVARYRGDHLEKLKSPDHGLIAVESSAARCVEVLLLEVTERKLGDREVLQLYWGKWLGEMGVRRFEMKMTSDSAALTRDVVERFLRSASVGGAS